MNFCLGVDALGFEIGGQGPESLNPTLQSNCAPITPQEPEEECGRLHLHLRCQRHRLDRDPHRAARIRERPHVPRAPLHRLLGWPTVVRLRRHGHGFILTAQSVLSHHVSVSYPVLFIRLLPVFTYTEGPATPKNAFANSFRPLFTGQIVHWFRFPPLVPSPFLMYY